MTEKDRWENAEDFLRRVSRREDKYLDGVRDEDIEQIPRIPGPLDQKPPAKKIQTGYNPRQQEIKEIQDLMEDNFIQGGRHSSGYGRFIANDINERGTGAQPGIEGFQLTNLH